MNYDLCLRLSTEDGELEASTVVNQDLEQNYKISSWQEGNCSGEPVGSQASEQASGQAGEETVAAESQEGTGQQDED